MANNPDTLVKFAVQEIVNQINTGMTPQDATEKVARELDLNPNFIKRASEAINVALHYNHFKKHAEAKADDFPIVDAQKIAENIFGAKEKTASQLKSDLMSSFQAEEITPKFARYLEDGPHKEVYTKLANAQVETKFEMSERGIYEKSANYIRELKKQAEDTKAAAIEAEWQTNRAFCNLLEKFARAEGYRSTFENFESQAWSLHGNKANNYLDLIYKTAHLTEPRGAHDPNYKMFEPCDEVKSFGLFLKRAEELPTIKQAAEDANYNYNFENDYIQEIYKSRGCELHKISSDQLDSSILERLENEVKKEAAAVEAIAETDPVMEAVKSKKAEALKETEHNVKIAATLIEQMLNQAKGLSKPSIKATTNTAPDNRERAFLLQELAYTDPILANIPPKKVVDAYQQMLRLAPEISKEKELVRAFLRNSTASQAIGTHEGQQLVEADDKLLRHRMLQMGVSGKGQEGEGVPK